MTGPTEHVAQEATGDAVGGMKVRTHTDTQGRGD